MSNHNETKSIIIGGAISGTIGEPWDFFSLAGEGRIRGTVSATSKSNGQIQWIEISVSPFTNNGVEIRELLGVRRYSQSKGLIEELIAGEVVGLNLLFNIAGRPISHEDVQKYEFNGSEISFLIGSVQLAV